MSRRMFKLLAKYYQSERILIFGTSKIPAVAALLSSMNQLMAMFAAQSAINNIAVSTL